MLHEHQMGGVHGGSVLDPSRPPRGGGGPDPATPRCPAGDESVVLPDSKQLPLPVVVQMPHSAHDQPVALVAGLGDLRDPRVGVADVDPGMLGDGRDLLADRFGQPDRDRVAHPVASQRLDRLGGPKPRVHAYG
jgi:hypothetical protein